MEYNNNDYFIILEFYRIAVSPVGFPPRPRRRNQVLPNSANRYDTYLFILTFVVLINKLY